MINLHAHMSSCIAWCDSVRDVFSTYSVLYFLQCMALCGMTGENMVYVIDYNVLIKHRNIIIL